MRTFFNKAFLVPASALSIFAVLLAAPQAVSAQEEMTEDMEMEATESVEMEDDRVGQSIEMDRMDVDSDIDSMDDNDIDSDIDYDDDDSDIEAETYSNSPRALWQTPQKAYHRSLIEQVQALKDLAVSALRTFTVREAFYDCIHTLEIRKRFNLDRLTERRSERQDDKQKAKP